MLYVCLFSENYSQMKSFSCSYSILFFRLIFFSFFFSFNISLLHFFTKRSFHPKIGIFVYGIVQIELNTQAKKNVNDNEAECQYL